LLNPGSYPGSDPPSAPSRIDLLYVDTEILRNAATGFQSEAGLATTVHERLRATASANASSEAPWGDDPIGASFASWFVPVSEATFEALRKLPEILGEIADALTVAAADFDAAEDENCQSAQLVMR
jgi:hypothetical protein